MTRPKQCRRKHALIGDNVRKQTNKSTRADGKVVKYKTSVCVKCCKVRYHRRTKGLAVKDLRKGAR